MLDKGVQTILEGQKRVFTLMSIALIAVAFVALVLVGVWRLRRPKPVDRAEKQYWEIH